jgi:proteic killer suppression protein
MIRNIGDRETELVWRGVRSRKLPPEIQQTARRKLRQLHNVSAPGELAVPRGNRLVEFMGERQGRYSILINAQCLITFRWRDGDAHDVRIEDYHS